MDRCAIWAGLLMFTPVIVFAQLSPGPLSSPHSSLEGTLQCVKCHALGAGRAQFKCAGCHADVATNVQNNRGYHARVVDRAKGDSDCVRCHAEHAGRDATLIRWPVNQSSFDHSQTGYRLEGKHTALQCNQCHKTKSFLGLQTQCLSCHQDQHKGQLGTNCTSCHSQESWKAVANFNHQLTRFALTGLHAKVACERCHTPAPGVAARYKDIPFSECSSCHRDPHRGAFQAPCAQCHNTSGWQTARALISTNFDHSKTHYPLIGRHAPLQCRSCHKTSNFSAPIASARCTDCHADKHSGQFAKRADRGDCIGCHTVNGFKPSTFNVAAHALTKYPLLGKHAPVSCEKCHAPKGESTNYHPQSASCVNCHSDVHQGQFKERFLDRCESCHRVEGFAPSTFTLVRHREARFALAGAHGAVACVDCHKATASSAAHRYVFADTSCIGCHSDPHSLSPDKRNCETCHTDRAWIPARPFDHAATRFPLSGLHRSVTCLACHKPDVTTAAKRVPFSGTPTACASCHEDIHGGQFARLPVGAVGEAPARQRAASINDRPTDCTSCHQTAGWKPVNFDHNTSAFPLDGRHRAVPCASCHKQRSPIRGREVLVYRGAPKECAQCH